LLYHIGSFSPSAYSAWRKDGRRKKKWRRRKVKKDMADVSVRYKNNGRGHTHTHTEREREEKRRATHLSCCHHELALSTLMEELAW
jgi:hypothetical protein